MAVITGVLSPVRRPADRPRAPAATSPGSGWPAARRSLFWLAAVHDAGHPIWLLLLPIALMGVANGGMWAPISTTATRNLPMSQAGAGVGRLQHDAQVGAVLGSAAIAALMQSRLQPNCRAPRRRPGRSRGASRSLHAGFSAAMGQALLLPAVVAMVGFVAVLFYAKPSVLGRPADVREAGTDVREPAADVREASADPAESPVPPSS